MANTVIVDSGPLISLFDKSDKYHKRAKSKISKLRSENSGELLTVWPVITEAAYILKEHVHLQAELDFLKWINLGGLDVFKLARRHLTRVIALQEKYSDISMDFADAALITAAEDSDIEKIFSFDKDFSIYRSQGKKRLKNLMLDN